MDAAAANADATRSEGFALKMLAEMVADRLGGKLDEASGNPWWRIHSPLMEFDELMLEGKGQVGRIRPYGFLRHAYRDDIDGSPQFCRAYLRRLRPGQEVAAGRANARIQFCQSRVRPLVER
jgi:hypothetical protein